MATYAIGDVQGCYYSLEKLLDKVGYRPNKDILWFAGDLVNRGRHSLEVLRFLYNNQDNCKVVLGNHDLHLIAMYHGLRKRKPLDTLKKVLVAKDADDLIAWLGRQPLIVQNKHYVMVHAGLRPSWSLETAEKRSADIGEMLEEAPEEILPLGRSKGKLAKALQWFTTVRYINGEGKLLPNLKMAPEVTHDATPWYKLPRQHKKTILFGHWATLGHRFLKRAIALDSGCVWGGKLTAIRLKDQEVFQVRAAKQDL